MIPAIANKIMLDGMDRIEQKGIRQTETVEDFLDILIDTNFEITEEYQDMILFLYSGIYYHNVLESWEQVYKPYYDTLEKNVSDFQDRKLLPANRTANEMVDFIVGLIEHSAEKYYFFKSQNSCLKDLKETIKKFILYGLKG